MTRSDICTIGAIYATCLIFFYMTLQLKAAAQIYPLCLIGGLAVLNTLYLAKCLWKYFHTVRDSSRLSNDFPEIFKNFLPRQFFFVMGACVAYMVLLHIVGFYLAGFIYLVIVMWNLHVKKIQLWLTVILLGSLVYGVFTLFLKVPLPKGILFG